MTKSIYKIWIITGMLLLAAGIPFFYPDLRRIVAFLAGAGIMFINVLLLGKALTALFGRTQAEADPQPGHESGVSPAYEGEPPMTKPQAKGRQPVFIFLLILKYAFLLTTLYIAIVIIKFHPVPFVVGITILPVSIMMMGIFLMLRRHDNA